MAKPEPNQAIRTHATILSTEIISSGLVVLIIGVGVAISHVGPA